MRHLLLSVVLSMLATAALAQRPSTLGMSCDEANDLVASRGAVVLSTGRHTFNRFVASAGFCSYGEYAYDGWAPTSDGRRCRIGYICKKDTPLFDDGSLFDIPGR
jgi:hypothetical protein